LSEPFEIRDLAPGDKADWLGLWSGYLSFYKVDLDPAVTDHTWARLLDPGSALAARVAFGPNGLLGFAIHLHHPSTWVAGEDCYLEDLFVSHDARGQGVGRALIDDLRVLARSRGWHRLYWHTDQDNTRARALYDSIVPSDGHVRYRLKL
jgi:GNAT superfamily N-acetyltransferase